MNDINKKLADYGFDAKGWTHYVFPEDCYTPSRSPASPIWEDDLIKARFILKRWFRRRKALARIKANEDK